LLTERKEHPHFLIRIFKHFDCQTSAQQHISPNWQMWQEGSCCT